MSRDFQIAWPCAHVTMEEVAPLGSDRRSLLTRQPVAGSNTVRIMANDEVFIPPGGLQVPAALYGTGSGPFDIIAGEDELVVTTSAGTQTFKLKVTSTRVRMTAVQVIASFLRDGLSVAQAEDVHGHLLFVDPYALGTTSFVDVRGTAAAALGFGAAGVNGFQRRAIGKSLYPGWRLFTRPDEITNRYPRFDQPIPGDPVFKVTYTVPGNRCLRCGGTYIENDYRFDTLGQALMVDNEDLLYQAALKILLTDVGSNPYHPWYGTSLRSRIGSKAISGVATIINEDVRRALVKLQQLQESQARYQQVTFKERLYAIRSVQVAPHAQDPTTYMVDVVVQNASSEPVRISIVFTVPSVVALMGSNGLLLGTEAAGITVSQAANLFLPDRGR